MLNIKYKEKKHIAHFKDLISIDKRRRSSPMGWWI
jgi:hypothetical protein